MVHIPPHSFLASTCISVVFRNVALDAVTRSQFRNTVLRIDLLIRQILKRTVQQKLLFLKILLEMELLIQINVNVCSTTDISRLLELGFPAMIFILHVSILPWVRRTYAPQSFGTRFF